MKKFLIILLSFLFCFNLYAQPRGGTPATKIEEEDGSPSVRARTVKFNNGSVTDNGDGTASIDFWGAIATNLIPSADDTYDIGENTTPLEWKDIYIDGIAYIDQVNCEGALNVDGSAILGNSATDYHAINTSLNALKMLNTAFTSDTKQSDAWWIDGDFNYTTTPDQISTPSGYGIRLDFDHDGTINANTFEITHNLYGIDLDLTSAAVLEATNADNIFYLRGARIVGNFTGTNTNAKTLDIYGIDVASSGNLGTTGNTSHIAGNFTASGTGDANIGVEISSSGGTINDGLRINSGELWILTDNDEIQIGAGRDLRLYHDGTDSIITTDTGDLKLSAAGGDIDCADENITTTGIGTFGSVVVDNLTLNGDYITSSTGEVDFDNENIKTSGNITNVGSIVHLGTSAFYITNFVQDQDMIFQTNDGGAVKTITWDADVDKLKHSAGTFDFDNDHITTSGNITGVNVTSGADPGHTHTGGSLGSIDISDDTNLAATAPIILTDDTLSLDYEGTDFSVVGTTLTITDTGINHDGTTNFAANEHIDHTAVTLTAGAGLSGGGDISANRTFAFDATELDALTWDGGTLASIAWNWNLSAGDPTITFGNDLVTFSNSVTINTGKNFTLGTTQWNSADEIDGTKIKDADYGDVVIDAAGDWQVSEGEVDHDSLLNFAANEHIDWTIDQGATNIHSGNYSDTQLNEEQVQDFAWNVLSGTQTLITVTYQDATDDVEFVVNDDLSLYDNTTSAFITATLTQEQVEDYAGALMANATGTHTGISVTYQDATGDMDLIIDHDAASNFVANEHIDHTAVTLTAGTGLSGGGDISANRTFNLDINGLAADTIAAADTVAFYDNDGADTNKITFANLEGTLTHDNLVAGTIADHDTSATGAELDTLTDNSIANTLHRHSELVASDGTPDPALSVDASGDIIIPSGGSIVIGRASASYDNIDIQMAADESSAIWIDGETNDYTGTGGGWSQILYFKRDLNSGDGNEANTNNIGAYISMDPQHTKSVLTSDNQEIWAIYTPITDTSTWENTTATNRIVYKKGSEVYMNDDATYNSTSTGYILPSAYGTSVILDLDQTFSATGGATNYNYVYGHRILINNNPTISSGNLTNIVAGLAVDITGTAAGASTNYGINITRVTGADNNYAIYDNSGADWILDADNQKIRLGETQGDYDLYSDGTYGKIDCTSGLIINNKLAFTQTDLNEYWDSLADGYLDGEATTGIRWRINTAQEMELNANTLTFEAGAVDPVLDWSTSGQLAFTTGTLRVDDKVVFTQVDNNEYIDSLADGYLDIGATTAVRLKPVTIAEDAIYFTQTDGNEKIDSANDGYMDYYATTGHRFNNDVAVTGDLTVSGSATLGDATSDIHGINTSPVAKQMVTASFAESSIDTNARFLSGTFAHSGGTSGSNASTNRMMYFDFNSSGTVDGDGTNEKIDTGIYIDYDSTVDLTTGSHIARTLDILNAFSGTMAAGTLNLTGARFVVGGNLGTTGTTSKDGLEINVTGTADINTGIDVISSGASTNYAIKSAGNNWLSQDNNKTIYGAGGSADSYIQWDAAGLDFYSSGGIYDFNAAANTDITFNFLGTTASGSFLWDEDNDYFNCADVWLFPDNIELLFGSQVGGDAGLHYDANNFSIDISGATAAGTPGVVIKLNDNAGSSLFSILDSNDISIFSVNSDGAMNHSLLPNMPKIYDQAAEPDIPNNTMAFWVDSDDSDRNWLILDVAGVQKKVELT